MKKLYQTLVFFFLSILVPFFVSAQLPGEGGGETNPLTNPLGENTDIYSFLETLVDLVVQIGFYVALVAIIYSGFLFVTAQGNESKLEKAKNALTYSLIGTAILMSAWVFAIAIKGAVDDVVNTTTGVITDLNTNV